MNRTVLIVGATGDTGKAAVAESILAGLHVRAMVHRNDARSDALAALGAEVVLGDLGQIDTIAAAMRGIDAGYFVYPVQPGLIGAAVNFARAAVEERLSLVVDLSQRSANRYSKSDSCRDSFITEEVFKWSGLPLVILRPTLFLEWLLYPWQLPLIRDAGVIRMPMGKGRHAPVAAFDQGRAIAAILKDPTGLVGQTIDLSGPVEMDYDRIAAEVGSALGREIVFEDVPIGEYCDGLATSGLPAYAVQHFRGAMDDFQHGWMSGSDSNIERLTGKRPMTVGEFAKAHAAELNPSREARAHLVAATGPAGP